MIEKVEQQVANRWPEQRYHHAATCLGYGGEYVHLLILGGINQYGKCLNDMWLFSLGEKGWKEVLDYLV